MPTSREAVLEAFRITLAQTRALGRDVDTMQQHLEEMSSNIQQNLKEMSRNIEECIKEVRRES